MEPPRGACLPVRLDGAPIPADRSARDVDRGGAEPCIFADGPRSYDFYAGPVETHTVEIVFPTGSALYTFDFAPMGRA
jgi:hypothetical protein